MLTLLKQQEKQLNRLSLRTRLSKTELDLRWRGMNEHLAHKLGDNLLNTTVGLAAALGVNTTKPSVRATVNDLHASIEELRDTEGSVQKDERRDGHDLEALALSFLVRLGSGLASSAISNSLASNTANDVSPDRIGDNLSLTGRD